MFAWSSMFRAQCIHLQTRVTEHLCTSAAACVWLTHSLLSLLVPRFCLLYIILLGLLAARGHARAGIDVSSRGCGVVLYLVVVFPGCV